MSSLGWFTPTTHELTGLVYPDNSWAHWAGLPWQFMSSLGWFTPTIHELTGLVYPGFRDKWAKLPISSRMPVIKEPDKQYKHSIKTDVWITLQYFLLVSWYNVLLRIVSKSYNNWAPSSEFVSSSIPSWQILTAHAQPFRGARDLAFCLKVPLDSLLIWASSEGSGETAGMRRLAWTFAARIGYKYQNRLTWSNYYPRRTTNWRNKGDVMTLPDQQTKTIFRKTIK